MLGNYQLLLAHDVLDNPQEYREIYGDLARDKDAVVIMDNSLIELGYPLDVRAIIDACRAIGIIRADSRCTVYSVLPDYLKDRPKTLDASFEAYSRLKEVDRDGRIKPLAVIQGDDTPDCINCLTAYLHKISELECVSIPRVVRTFGSRTSLAYLATMGGLKVHLLGFSDDLIDDVATARLPGVIGIDSTFPVRCALQMRTLVTLDYEFKPYPRGDFWDEDWASYIKMGDYDNDNDKDKSEKAMIARNTLRLLACNLELTRQWIISDMK